MRRPSLGAIFLTVFLDLLGFGLVLPFLANEARDTYGTPAAVATLLGSVYSLMQFFFVPVWGRLSDRIGRRPVIVWSVAGTALSMAGLGLGLAFGASVVWLFVARVFAGIATANLGTASAYIADITTPEDRSRGMGMIGIAFGLGFILGPSLGGALAEITVNGHRGVIPCFLAAGLSAINFVWAFSGLPESLPPERRNLKARRSLRPLDLEQMKTAFAHPGVALAVFVNFLVILAFTNLDQTFALFNADVFHNDERDTGFLLAFVGIMAAAVQGGIRPLSKHVSDANLIRAGVALQMLAFACLVAAGKAESRPLLFVAMATLALGNGLTQPTTPAFISTRAPREEQGATLGTNQAFASLARTFGPATGGYLFQTLGPRAPYVAASLGMAVALLLAFGLKGRIPQPRVVKAEPADT